MAGGLLYNDFMAAITISRQMGSLGCQIAEEVAERLGFRRVWREIINQAALRVGAPETALAAIDELGLLGLKPAAADLAAYHRAVKQIMMELAEAGSVVIVGRAGQAILRGRADILHVRLVAPLALRVERIMTEESLGREAAQALVERSDRSRKQYLKQYYQIDVDDPGLYDLVVSTGRLSNYAAADIICQAFYSL